MEEILDSLRKEDIVIRLSAVSEFGSVSAESLPALFDAAVNDLNREVREAAARLIPLCPIAFERYLLDVDSRVQAAVVSNSVEI
jgi:pyruvate/2-oxoglutarate/acetoin dehydrogenase E1 component